jgi:hypothetical protein
MNTEAIVRLNRSIDWVPRRFLAWILSAWVMGPLGVLWVRLNFRVRNAVPDLKASMAIPGAATPFGDRVILAVQHYYEWDAALPYCMLLWPYSLLRPGFLPLLTAGDFWSRNPFMRAIAWLFGLLCFVPGREPEDGAMRILATLFSRRSNLAAVIYPTGPIGRRTRFILQRGIGWLALEQPDVPIVPIAFGGVRDLRLRDMILLKRPVLSLRQGRPFRGRDIAGATRDERETAVCDEIARQWRELEKGP